MKTERLAFDSDFLKIDELFAIEWVNVYCTIKYELVIQGRWWKKYGSLVRDLPLSACHG